MPQKITVLKFLHLRLRRDYEEDYRMVGGSKAETGLQDREIICFLKSLPGVLLLTSQRFVNLHAQE